MVALSVVVGNPNPRSRTLEIAELLGERVSAITGAVQRPTLDLIDVAGELFQWPSPQLDALTDEVASADIVVFASPTYKASYSGLLKSFLDRYGSDGLSGVTAIPLFTTGSPQHHLAVEFTLRPLLVELGASVPTRGLSFPTADHDRREHVVDAWLEASGAPLARSFPRAGEAGA